MKEFWKEYGIILFLAVFMLLFLAAGYFWSGWFYLPSIGCGLMGRDLMDKRKWF